MTGLLPVMTQHAIQDASPLLTDLYQLNMMQAYLEGGQTQTAVFELYVRKLPPQRGFVIAAGLEQNPDPSEDEAREMVAGNLCRCTGYQNIGKAVLRAAEIGLDSARPTETRA